MNFRYRLMQFMSGRYGTDQLFYGLIAAAVTLSFLNLFIRSFIVQMLVYALLGYSLFRVLSRNLDARRRENYWFRDKVSFIKRKKEIYDQRRADKCHVYKKCPSCKAILRLPHRIGKHKTVCPRCNREFTVKVRK
ncbi:MAG: hypothetical protein E7524_06740 [Ruminococcaceae bacterium]|nr:hypothetical protein [Oscillospiraceae bacterium]